LVTPPGAPGLCFAKGRDHEEAGKQSFRKVRSQAELGNGKRNNIMNHFDSFVLTHLLDSAMSLRLTLTLLHFVWQGALLGLIAFVADHALRRAASRTRYAIFVGILATMGTALPTTFLLIRTGGPATKPALSLASTATPAVMTNSLVPAKRQLVARSAQPANPIPISESEPIADFGPAEALLPLPPTVSELSTTRLGPYAATVTLAYLVGIVLMLTRLAAALHGGRRLRLAATPISDGPVAELVRRQAQRLGMKTAPLVAWCGRMSVPVVVGIIRPMILLPSALATGFDPLQLEALITHELAHIRRFDPLVNLLQRLIEVLLFFHPAVWYVSRRVSAERENACDDLVLLAGWPAVRYAHALLQMAEVCQVVRGLSPESSAALAATGGGSSQFKRRVLRLLDIDDAPRLRLTRAGAMAAAVALVFIAPTLIPALAQKTSQSADEKAEPAAQSQITPGAGQALESDPLPAGAVLRLGTARLRHARSTLSAAFSPNGKILASTAWLDPNLKLWDVATGRLIRTLGGPPGDTPRAAVFSPDGSTLAVTCERGTVQLWGVGTGTLLWQSKALRERRDNAVTFAPDGKSLATSAGGEGNVRVWDIRNGRELLTLHPAGRRAEYLPIAFSPDGTLLACGGERQIRFYDFKKGVEVGAIENAHGDQVSSLAFSPDGKTLFSAGSEYQLIREDVGQSVAQLRMWDVASRKLIRDFFGTKVEPGGCTAVLSRDGRHLVCRLPNKLLVWDVGSGKISLEIPNGWLPSIARDRTIDVRWGLDTNGVAISPDGATIAAVGHPLHHITLWDTATGAERLALPDTHSAEVRALTFSADGKLIATGGGDDCTVRLCDGKTLVAAGQDRRDGHESGLVRLYDSSTGTIRREVRAGADVAHVALSNDGRKLAIAASSLSDSFARKRANDRNTRQDPPNERFLLIVDTNTGAQLRRIELEGQVRAVGFSPDGAAVTVIDASGSLRTWDVASGRLLGTVGVPEMPSSRTSSRWPTFAGLSRDGAAAVVSCLDGKLVSIFDLANGKQIGQFDVEDEGTIAGQVAISPDKRVIATASIRRGPLNQEFALRLWDAQTARLLKRYSPPHENRIVALEFAADGRRLISGMSDGTTLVWEVPKP
jgi:WD40 repeat protein/beta-lactamase regulating signal transducer with metallopeptidase domain